MTTIRFTADIREDQVIHPPAGVHLSPGKAEIIVLQPLAAGDDLPDECDRVPAGVPEIAKDFAEFAGQQSVQGLPSDLALNH